MYLLYIPMKIITHSETSSFQPSWIVSTVHTNLPFKIQSGPFSTSRISVTSSTIMLACCCRLMKTQNTTRPHSWLSYIASPLWQILNLFSPSAIPTRPNPLTTHATVSSLLSPLGSQQYVMALLVTLMLYCTSGFILAFYHLLIHQTWLVGFPYIFRSSSQCR